MELSCGAFVCPAGLGSADLPFLGPVDWLRCPSMTAAEAQEGSGGVRGLLISLTALSSSLAPLGKASDVCDPAQVDVRAGRVAVGGDIAEPHSKERGHRACIT